MTLLEHATRIWIVLARLDGLDHAWSTSQVGHLLGVLWTIRSLIDGPDPSGTLQQLVLHYNWKNSDKIYTYIKKFPYEKFCQTDDVHAYLFIFFLLLVYL